MLLLPVPDRIQAYDSSSTKQQITAFGSRIHAIDWGGGVQHRLKAEISCTHHAHQWCILRLKTAVGTYQGLVAVPVYDVHIVGQEIVNVLTLFVNYLLSMRWSFWWRLLLSCCTPGTAARPSSPAIAAL